MCQLMPTGLYTHWDFDSETGKLLAVIDNSSILSLIKQTAKAVQTLITKVVAAFCKRLAGKKIYAKKHEKKRKKDFVLFDDKEKNNFNESQNM